MRIESAGRMEFRRQREHVEVFNDDRQVACIEGSFIAFSKGASLSVDETAAIVEYARTESHRRECARELCEAVRRIMGAHGLPIPDNLDVGIIQLGAATATLMVRLDMVAP